MPDHAEGYARRGDGVMEADEMMARRYRKKQKGHVVVFDLVKQRVLVEALRKGGERQRVRVHAVGTDESHVHAVVSWEDERDVERVRGTLRASLSRRLNGEFGKREWFSKTGHWKRVVGRSHFDKLVLEYLPGHRGLFWCEGG